MPEHNAVNDDRWSPPYIPRVAARDQLPRFKLPSALDGEIGPSDFKPRKNLVVYFFQGDKCERCEDTLNTLAQYYQDYREQEAEILAVDTEQLDKVKQLAKERQVPFPLLADPSGAVFRRYVQEGPDGELPVVAVFIADRFGEVFAEYLANEAENAPEQREIIEWLRLIEIQCPECGAPEWRL